MIISGHINLGIFSKLITPGSLNTRERFAVNYRASFASKLREQRSISSTWMKFLLDICIVLLRSVNYLVKVLQNSIRAKESIVFQPVSSDSIIVPEVVFFLSPRNQKKNNHVKWMLRIWSINSKVSDSGFRYRKLGRANTRKKYSKVGKLSKLLTPTRVKNF